MKTKTTSMKSATFAKAGNKGMAGKSGATPSRPGQVSSGGKGMSKNFTPDTGSGRMAGKSGSMPAKPC
jgi:hypothetical protein